MKKTILITGANRGLGLEFTRQLSLQDVQIIACCREPEQAKELIQLAKNNNHISIHQLDVTNDEAIQSLAQELGDRPLDWIIHNAGISGEKGVTTGNIDRKNFLHVMNVNCLSPLKISDILLKNVSKSQDKLIVCISSKMGSIADNSSGRSYAYRSSKAALNCAMRSFALDVQPLGINVILLHPGWVKTAMGGPDALTDAKTSITSMLEQIEKRKKESHAQALYAFDGQKIDW